MTDFRSWQLALKCNWIEVCLDFEFFKGFGISSLDIGVNKCRNRDKIELLSREYNVKVFGKDRFLEFEMSKVSEHCPIGPKLYLWIILTSFRQCFYYHFVWSYNPRCVIIQVQIHVCRCMWTPESTETLESTYKHGKVPTETHYRYWITKISLYLENQFVSEPETSYVLHFLIVHLMTKLFTLSISNV